MSKVTKGCSFLLWNVSINESRYFFASGPFGIRYFRDFTKYWWQLLFKMFVNETSKQLKNLIEVT